MGTLVAKSGNSQVIGSQDPQGGGVTGGARTISIRTRTREGETRVPYGEEK